MELENQNNKEDTFRYVKALIDNYVDNVCVFNDLTNLADVLNGQPEKFMKMWYERVSQLRIPDEFWKLLYEILDKRYYGAFDKMISLHNVTKDRYINMLAMICCNYSHHQIAICCGFSNDFTVKTTLSRIKKHMRIASAIPEYLEELSKSK